MPEVTVRVLIALVVLSTFAFSQKTASKGNVQVTIGLPPTVVLLRATHAFNDSKFAQLIAAHVAYWKDFANAGNHVLDGQVSDKKFKVAVILHIKDPKNMENLRRVVVNDPLVRKKQCSFELYSWPMSPQLSALQRSKPLTINADSKTYYLGLYSPGHNFRKLTQPIPAQSSPQRRALQAAEKDSLEQLVDSGKLIADGPLSEIVVDWRRGEHLEMGIDNLGRPTGAYPVASDPPRNSGPQRLMLLQASDLQVALKSANIDAEVLAGKYTVQVFEWTLLLGSK